MQSRTIQNMVNSDIIQTIRSTGDIDLLDIDFEYSIDNTKIAEYGFGHEDFYKTMKQEIINFIKKTPLLQQTIVDNYCDGMMATLDYAKRQEHLIPQREKTSKELFVALGMEEDFPLNRQNKFTTDALVLGSYGNNREKELPDGAKEKFIELKKIGNKLR